jgi:hypothetical protein
MDRPFILIDGGLERRLNASPLAKGGGIEGRKRAQGRRNKAGLPSRYNPTGDGEKEVPGSVNDRSVRGRSQGQVK